MSEPAGTGLAMVRELYLISPDLDDISDSIFFGPSITPNYSLVRVGINFDSTCAVIAMYQG